MTSRQDYPGYHESGRDNRDYQTTQQNYYPHYSPQPDDSQRNQLQPSTQQWGQQTRQPQPQGGGMQISNPQTGHPLEVKGPEFDDRDRINDLLGTEKYLIDNINTFAKEASHQNLFNDLLHILNETHHQGRQVFNVLFEKGWYSLQSEPIDQVQDTQQTFSHYANQFSGGNRLM